MWPCFSGKHGKGGLDMDEDLPGPVLAMAPVVAMVLLASLFTWFLSGTTLYEVISSIATVVKR
ncbi:hypothetical protein HYV91_00405 [Candidatus Wolfebacteria bacterium]|nr:hypothetical protein [Candidatus Wolfebacteria bacterium]